MINLSVSTRLWWLTLLVYRVLATQQPVSSASSYPSSTGASRKVVIGVDGGTESIRACCFDGITGAVIGRPCAQAYRTTHPHPGWAEQRPADWWSCLGRAVRGAVASVADEATAVTDGVEFCAMSVDTTCCSVVALDASGEPLRPCLLWMDQRSAPQTEKVLATGDAALAVNCNGQGPVSAEWMTPKALWIAENEPSVWQDAETICEYQDYINFKLTGIMCASSCNAATRWHWDGEKCIQDPTVQYPRPGRPLSLYQKLGIPELADKLPEKCLPMGAAVGALTSDAAKHLGLPQGLPVVQGGADAFVGIIGLGCVAAGQLCLITGSSHLHCVVTAKPTTAPGTWGAYRGAPLPGLNFAEGGQSSTGSILRFARNLFGGADGDDSTVNYKALDAQAANVAPGADGLIALETFQGSRTPVTDPLARGALLGLTLSHTRGHVWRSLLEAVCFGTRACMESLAAAGHDCEEIVLAGGVTRTDLWLQMHADVTGKTISVCENSDAPLLGCAILASHGVGLHSSVQDAVHAMVRTEKRITPNPATVEIYDKIYHQVYSKVASAARPVTHAIHNLRGGESQPSESTEDDTISNKPIVISPSLLACDWADIRGEVHRCLDVGLSHFHVDIFDGVFLDSPNALTFGPQMVNAIRRSCDSHPLDQPSHKRAFLDLHMCVDRPGRFVDAMALVGADCFIFQWEAVSDLIEAKSLAEKIVEAGMKCGVSVNPASDVEEIYPLLMTGVVQAVDVLAVEPGFGGQRFQPLSLKKVQALKEWRESAGVPFDIMVDGGINEETVVDATKAGADILVAGSFLFQHKHGVGRAASLLSPLNRNRERNKAH